MKVWGRMPVGLHLARPGLITGCLITLVGLFAPPLLAQTDFVGTVKRFSNPPQNVFVFQTKSIEEIGEPLCIDRLVLTAKLLDGSRDSEGEERLSVQTYKLALIEQRNGITRPRFVNFGRGHLLSLEVKAYRVDDEVCRKEK